MKEPPGTSSSGCGAHRHGGDPGATFARLGLKARPTTDFSVNVNPFGPPPSVLSHPHNWRRDIGCYPTPDGAPVARFYQTRWGLAPDRVLPGNGSVALMYFVLGVLRLQRLAVVTPSFHDYARAARAAGTQTVSLALPATDGFAPPSVVALEEALARADGLILGQPNNPTGTLHAREALLELARRHEDKWLLVDEAFIQFVDDHGTRTLLAKQSLPANVLVFHSLTKFYALPGLRLGAVIGCPATIAILRDRQEPWAINRSAESAALALIETTAYEAETTRWMTQERRRLTPPLQATRGVRFFEPAANFVLGQWQATDDLDDLLRGLLEAGYHVRDCRNFPGLERNYFRFALRRTAENDALLQTITTLTAACHA